MLSSEVLDLKSCWHQAGHELRTLCPCFEGVMCMDEVSATFCFIPRCLHSPCCVQWVEQKLFQMLMPDKQSRTPELPFQH